MDIRLLFFVFSLFYANFLQAQLPTVPIDFEPSTINYQFTDFGGTITNGIIANPDIDAINSSSQVLEVHKTSGAQTWGGMFMNLGAAIDFSVGTTIELKVRSPRINVPILLKIEDTSSPPDGNGNPTVFAQVQLNTTVQNDWEVLVFDMATYAGFNTTISYDRVVLFPDFGNDGLGELFHFDDIANENTVAPPVDTGCTDTINIVSYTHAIDSTVHAEHVVKSDAQVPSALNVIYHAGSMICLNPGFAVDLGSEFLASILDCCEEKTWYRDTDGDGLGNPYDTVVSCEQPAGYTEFSIDNRGYTTPDNYAGSTLVWQDEFDGTALNIDDWTYEIGNGCPNLCGWGNNEEIWYLAQNTTVADDFLTIEAKEESVGGESYTSSRIKTQGKQSFQYGRVDIRAKLPYSKGIWPALWMLGENINTVSWPACGEIDIMELIGGAGNDNVVHGTGHWDNNGHNFQGGSYTLPSGIFADEFHVFSIEWNTSEIRYYVDDIQYYSLNITPSYMNEFHNPFFFIFNVSVGGIWPGSPDGTSVFPQKMIVDYIRVFQ